MRSGVFQSQEARSRVMQGGGDLPLREGLVDISLSPSVKIAQRFCANKVLKANNFLIEVHKKCHVLFMGCCQALLWA